MHLAPTASRRVYQQRVGRIMRLHRRKEAGVVVDFAEPGAPHTERVITLHSLLGVDAYRPNGLVTPPPPRRRRWRRRPPKPLVKEANWIVPVSDDPERRIAVIANQWRLVDASKLPLDEQRAWAVVAARSVSPADVQLLAERVTGLTPEARELFFFTCAAENKHRRLRLQALGDLASQGPTQTTFAMACRLVEAAPTWQQDRGQGARILLLAMGDGRIEAPDDRIVAWTWQLARAARDHEYRYAGSHVNDGRSLLGALAAASSDAALTEAAARLATVATTGPLEAGAAILAVASPRRGTMAERLVERARMTLSADPPRLAAALGSNIPAPAARVKTQKRAKAKEKERADTISFNGAVVGSTPPAVAVARRDGTVTVPVSAEVAVRLGRRRRPGAAAGDAESLRWSLAGDGDAVFESAVDVRRAAADAAPLEVQVAKLLSGEALPTAPSASRSRVPGWWCRWAVTRARCCWTTPRAACSRSSRMPASAAASGSSSSWRGRTARRCGTRAPAPSARSRAASPSGDRRSGATAAAARARVAAASRRARPRRRCPTWPPRPPTPTSKQAPIREPRVRGGSGLLAGTLRA